MGRDRQTRTHRHTLDVSLCPRERLQSSLLVGRPAAEWHGLQVGRGTDKDIISIDIIIIIIITPSERRQACDTPIVVST